MKNEPKQIHLNIFLDQDGDDDQLNFNDLSEITWSEHMIYDNDIKYVKSEEWIPVTESLPERHQRVMFVVKSDNEWYNGKVYGGVYTDPDFTTPGMGFEATHWMPLPDAP